MAKKLIMICSLLPALLFTSCKVYLTKGDKVRTIGYSELPSKVQKSYFEIYRLGEEERIDFPTIVNLDTTRTEFKYVKNTSIEIIKAGNEVFEINGRQFYLPWNFNKETRPYLLADKHFYCIVGNKESWYNLSVDQLKRNQFLKIDLTKYLDY